LLRDICGEDGGIVVVVDLLVVLEEEIQCKEHVFVYIEEGSLKIGS
jgi:hypothetical protein